MPDYIIRSDEDKARLWRVMQGLAPKAWRVSITAYRARRSNDQNRRAFAVYRAVADETGHTVEEVHAICKHKFGEPTTYRLGEVEVTEYRTRDKDIGWMSNYIERLEAWAATEFGVCLAN